MSERLAEREIVGVEHSVSYDGSLTLFHDGQVIVKSHLATSNHGDTAGPIEPQPLLPQYPGVQHEPVAPAKTHRAMLKREAADKRRDWKWKVGAAAVAGVLAVGVPVRAIQIDQHFVAEIVQGESAPTAYPVGSHNYSGPIELHLGQENSAANKALPFTNLVASRDRPDKKPPATVTVAVGGLGINDAGPSIARPLLPAFVDSIENSKLYALTYGTRSNLPGIFSAVDAMLEESPTNYLNIWGMSTGCKVGQYIGAHVRERWPDVIVLADFCDSGPIDAYSTYELRRDPSKVTMGENSAAARLWGGPGLASVVDLLSDDTKRKYRNPDGTMNWEKFNEEKDRIIRDKWSKSAASNELYLGQLAWIVDNSAAENLAAIADIPDGRAPTVFVYIAPTEDRVVDGAYASRAYSDITNKLGIPTKIMPLKGVWHAGENDYSDDYNRVITLALGQIANENKLWYQQYRSGLVIPRQSPGRVGGI